MKIQNCKLALTALALGLTCATAQAAHDDIPWVKIGEKVDFKLKLTPGPVSSVVGIGPAVGEVNQTEIYRPGAGFIKLHFKHFSLPEGAMLTISNPSGTEVYRYGADAKQRDGMTFDVKSGDDGVASFSAMSISGERLILKLTDAQGNPLKRGYRVAIDYITQGFSNGIEMVETVDKLTGKSRLLDTCGAQNNRQDMMCYKDSNPKEFDRARPVARLITTKNGNTYTCTAWRVGENNHMMTNNHCVKDQNEVNNSELWFNYYNTQCGGSDLATITKITPKTLLKTNADLDYSLITVNDFNSIAGWGHFGLETRKPTAGERIYIPQHGAGRPKELSIESQMTNSGLCEIKYSDMSDYQAGYQCDTTGGSSGSPVLAANNNSIISDDRVVALHHWGGCKIDSFENVNRGVQISNIWPEIKGYFNNQVPKGDNEGPVDPDPKPPVADFSVATNGLTANFTNKSSDTNGHIASYLWRFGDGNTAVNSDPSHQYSAAGSYSATLTVTDNDGLTNSKTATVVVQDNNAGDLQNGSTVSGINGAKNEWRYYKFGLDQTTSNVQLTISGGSGDVDLYVNSGSKPTLNNHTCRPWKNGNNEQCTFTSLSAGQYHVGLHGYSAYSNVKLTLSYDDQGGNNDLNLTNLSASAKTWKQYTLQVPAGASSFNVETIGNSGDADLYIRYGSAPTTGSFDCDSTSSNSNEQCRMNNPQAGTWYIGVYAWSAFSGLTLKTTTE